MPDRFPTRPERLAEERRREAQEAREDPVLLNPVFPYRGKPFPAEIFSAVPLWAVDQAEE